MDDAILAPPRFHAVSGGCRLVGIRKRSRGREESFGVNTPETIPLRPRSDPARASVDDPHGDRDHGSVGIRRVKNLLIRDSSRREWDFSAESHAAGAAGNGAAPGAAEDLGRHIDCTYKYFSVSVGSAHVTMRSSRPSLLAV
jgi:hypothetical protein